MTTRPDIQKQLKFHMLARQAALRGLAAAANKDAKEAWKAQAEAEQYWRMYRKFGGSLDALT